MRKRPGLGSLVVVLCAVRQLEGRLIVVDNTVPRRDVRGNLLNAHDGHLYYDNQTGRFYLLGTAYTHCSLNGSTQCLQSPINPDLVPNHPNCGWTNNDFALYESPDLEQWTLLNPSLLPADRRPNGIYFRPKLIFNGQHWVLWWNYVTLGYDCASASAVKLLHGDCAQQGTVLPRGNYYATATSAALEGPFVLHTLPVVMGATGKGGFAHGDFNLFKDDDGRAYIIYNNYGIQGQNMVDRLSDDFTTSSKVSSDFLPTKTGEAQAMIKHDGRYYVVYGHFCCFCAEGSEAIVHVASSPLGPYTAANDIQLSPRGLRTIPAQQSFILQVGGRYLWGGDRWQSAPDGFKSHDSMAWVPLAFSQQGEVLPLNWTAQWSFEL